MSAVNVVCTSAPRNEIFLVTDAAYYLPDGVISKLSSKVVVAPNWKGVITGRGPSLELDCLQRFFAPRYDDFDELVNDIQEEFSDFASEVDLGNVELIVAGFSAARGCAESYVLYPSDSLPTGATPETDGIKPQSCQL